MSRIHLGAFGKLDIGPLSPIEAATLSPLRAATEGSALTAAALRTVREEAAAAAAPLQASSDECTCYLAKATEFALQARGTPLDENEHGALAMQCSESPRAVASMLSQAGVDIESCKPWYLRKKTWIYGGVGAVAIVGIGWVLGGSK